MIVYEGRLLAVRHSHDTPYLVLPGGHIDFGENPEECLHREMVEELGVEPVIGRLLYVNTFVDKRERQSIDFFFEVTNAEAFLNHHENDRSHAHELAEVLWVSPTDDVRILPEKFATDFKSGNFLSDTPRFIGD